MGRGLSPALMWFPSGPEAPLASDLEFIQDNSLLLPPVPTPSVLGLLAQGGGGGWDGQAPLPSAQTPREGRSGWKWEFLRAKPSVPSSLTFAAR